MEATSVSVRRRDFRARFAATSGARSRRVTDSPLLIVTTYAWWTPRSPLSSDSVCRRRARARRGPAASCRGRFPAFESRGSRGTCRSWRGSRAARQVRAGGRGAARGRGGERRRARRARRGRVHGSAVRSARRGAPERARGVARLRGGGQAGFAATGTARWGGGGRRGGGAEAVADASRLGRRRVSRRRARSRRWSRERAERRSRASAPSWASSTRMQRRSSRCDSSRGAAAPSATSTADPCVVCSSGSFRRSARDPYRPRGSPSCAAPALPPARSI